MVDIYERCLKLRKLSRSHNEHEAISAMRQLFKLMYDNGLTETDIDGKENVEVQVDWTVSFSRRSLALAAAVSRGCSIAENGSALFFIGPREGVESARELYVTFIKTAEKNGKLPDRTASMIMNSAWKNFPNNPFQNDVLGGLLGTFNNSQNPFPLDPQHRKKLDTICRDYFELGFFSSIVDRLQPPEPKPSANVFGNGINWQTVNTESIQPSKSEPVTVDDADRAALVALKEAAPLMPTNTRKRIAQEIKNNFVYSGKRAGYNITLPNYEYKSRQPVRGLLMAPDPKDVDKRNILKEFSSEIDLDV